MTERRRYRSAPPLAGWKNTFGAFPSARRSAELLARFARRANPTSSNPFVKLNISIARIDIFNLAERRRFELLVQF